MKKEGWLAEASCAVVEADGGAEVEGDMGSEPVEEALSADWGVMGRVAADDCAV